MRNVQIICATNPITSCARFGDYVMPIDTAASSHKLPSALDLLLAGLGADASEAVLALAAARGWPVEAVYVEVAMHGEAPWRAIGRRIWIDGDVDDRQLGELRAATERSSVAEALNPNICFRSAAARLPRPDRR